MQDWLSIGRGNDFTYTLPFPIVKFSIKIFSNHAIYPLNLYSCVFLQCGQILYILWQSRIPTEKLWHMKLKYSANTLSSHISYRLKIQDRCFYIYYRVALTLSLWTKRRHIECGSFSWKTRVFVVTVEVIITHITTLQSLL